jgi:hypothetical protein
MTRRRRVFSEFVSDPEVTLIIAVFADSFLPWSSLPKLASFPFYEESS